MRFRNSTGHLCELEYDHERKLKKTTSFNFITGEAGNIGYKTERVVSIFQAEVERSIKNDKKEII